MAHTIDITLKATDATGAAFDSAKANANRLAQTTGAGAASFRSYGAGADAASRSVDNAKMKTEALSGTVRGLTSVMSGNADGMLQLGAGLSRLSDKFMKMGGAVAAAGIGAMLGRELDEALRLSDRIAALLTGSKASEVMSFETAVKRRKEDFDAAAKRLSAAASAKGEQQEAWLAFKMPEGGPARDIAAQAEKARQQTDAMEAQMKAGRERLAVEQDKLRDINQKAWTPGQAFKAADQEREVKKAADDLSALEAVAKTKLDTLKLQTETVRQAALKAGEELKRQAASAQNAMELSDFQRSAERAVEVIKRIDDAMASLQDRRLRDLGLNALAAAVPPKQGEMPKDARLAADMLEQQKNRLAGLDAVGAFIKSERDPAAKDAARDQERARRATEQALKNAERREASGRELSKRDANLLAVNRAAGAGGARFDAKEQERMDKENERKRSEWARDQDAKRSRVALEEMRKKIDTLWQAAGGG
jgi:hypothetical protein